MQYVYPKFVVLILVATVTCAMTALNAAAAAGATTQPAGTRPTASRPAQVRPVEIIEHDFGTAWAGDVVKHTFEYTNATDRVLKIQEVTTTCGCTAMGAWAKQVQPGQVWKLGVNLSTVGRKGKQRKIVTITTDDPGQPEIRLVLTGEIQPRLEVLPAQNVPFGALPKDAAARRTLTITNNVERPVTITQVRTDSPAIRADLRVLKPGQRYELDVETVPPLPQRASLGSIVLETDLTEQPQLTVPVSVYVRPRVSLSPRIILVPQPVTKEIRRNLRLMLLEGTKAKVMDVEASAPAIRVSVKPIAESDAQGIEVVVPEGTELSRTETVMVSTDDPDVPELTCEVRPYRIARSPASRSASSQTHAPREPTAQADVSSRSRK